MKVPLFILGCVLTGLPLMEASYKVGIGIADVTGPAAEVTFMGYAKADQRGKGLHLRQFSRAFIFDDGNERIAYVSTDVGMMGHGVKTQVLKNLQKKYGYLYRMENVILSGTHTHSTPGGFLRDLLFDISIFGFVQDTYNAYISGITEAITRAHENMVEARLYLTRGELLNANINRSPTAYLNNPKEERDKYEYDVDKTMVQLKIISADSEARPLGSIQWFAIHPTSMNNTNHLVSSDNVGYASLLWERKMNNGTLPGTGKFVGAFASTNLGDVSPNIMGPKCQLTGKPCDIASSACQGRRDSCVASGPGRDMFDSTKIIAGRLSHKAEELWFETSAREVTGALRINHQYVHMPSQQVDWVNPVTNETETINFPYQWQPNTVACQVAMLGDLVLAVVPGEFTTMSGRRLRDTVKNAINVASCQNVDVVVAGLSNIYSDYIATPEEYQVQRYEGASTAYGPHTLTIYLHKYKELATALVKGDPVEPGPNPTIIQKTISFVPPVLFDVPGWKRHFGDCIQQPPVVAKPGDTVSAKFVSGHPRNNNMHGKTFLTIERNDGNGNWSLIATDACWETKFHWGRRSALLASSEATIEWEIPLETQPGEYRIRHYGNYKYILGGIFPYEGTSNSFQVQ